MDIVKQVADELEKREQEEISDHLYGLRHELIGKPCLYFSDGELKPAIPYGLVTTSEKIFWYFMWLCNLQKIIMSDH